MLAEKVETKKRNGKLAVRLTVMIAVLLSVIIALQNVVVIKFIQKRLLAESIERYSELSLNYAKTINQTLDEYLAELEWYAQQDVLKTGSNEQIQQWMMEHTASRPEEFMYVAWVDLDGNMYTDLGNITNVSDREYYKAVIKEGKDQYVNNPVISKTTQARVVHLTKAIKKDGKLTGAFVAVINIDTPGVFLGKIDVNPIVCVSLFSGDGQFMGMAGKTELMGLDKSSAEQIEEVNQKVNADIRQGKNGYIWVETPGAPTTGMFYAPIKYTAWSVSLTFEQKEIVYLSSVVQKLMMIFSIIITLTLIVAVSLSLNISLKPLKQLEKAINDISTGNADLSKRIDINVNNEIGRVVDGFNRFTEKLQTIIAAMKNSKEELVSAGQELNSHTEETSSSIIEIISNIESMGNNIETQTGIVSETAGAVNEIASNIESLNNMIESQSAAVTEASSAVEQMIGNIDSVSNSVQKMTDEFGELQIRVGNGIRKQEAVNEKIQVIEAESKTLQEANTVIANIAAQTNLLAMNAAIEAAHAGEAGKGFSVVADEIRKLSENSTKQSNSIGLQLKSIQDSINEIVSVSAEAKAAFSLVSNGIEGTDSIIREIAVSMKDQSDGSKQISVALTNMNDTSAEVASSSQEMSAGNKTILSEIKKLQDATFSMKSGMEEMSIGAGLINKTGAKLTGISEKMENSISQIGGQVDQFKV